jgi:hypothetical protein
MLIVTRRQRRGKEHLYDGLRAVGHKQNCYCHSIRSSSARNRLPLFGLIISTNDTRPSSCARKSGFPSRFWLSGPRRAQLARVALRRSKSARITFGCVLTTMPAQGLPHSLTHDAGLAEMHGEAFFHQESTTWVEKRSICFSKSSPPETRDRRRNAYIPLHLISPGRLSGNPRGRCKDWRALRPPQHDTSRPVCRSALRIRKLLACPALSVQLQKSPSSKLLASSFAPIA